MSKLKELVQEAESLLGRRLVPLKSGLRSTLERGPLRFPSAVLLSVLLAWVAVRTFGYDLDGDSSPDTVALGKFHFHLFWTGKDLSAKPVEEGRPVSRNWDDTLHEALAKNDFVFEFLHREDREEVATVREAAERIVGDARTDRQKVQRLLAWMTENWDFSIEHSTVNAAALLQLRQGMCETSGFFVGVLDTLGIKAREVNDAVPGQGPDTAVEVWLDGKWRVAYLFGSPKYIDDRSVLEMFAGNESDVCIVYYWRDPNGKLFRGKLWYDERVAPIFRTRRGLTVREVPDLAQLRTSY